MPDLDTWLKTADLDGARAALVEAVRARPDSVALRTQLFQLFAIGGEWDKAQRQLDTLTSLTEDARMMAMAYGQAMAAERQRAQVLSGAVRADLPVHFSTAEWAGMVAQSIVGFAAGEVEAAAQLREAAFAAAPHSPGALDGQAFDWIANADPRFGPTIEVHIAGQWGLLPFEAVASMTAAGPDDLCDLVWYPVEIVLRSGAACAGYIPTRYPLTETRGSSAARLGRVTDWIEGPSGYEGCGQQLLHLSDGQEPALLSLRKLTFA